jgi:hypothetical protein
MFDLLGQVGRALSCRIGIVNPGCRTYSSNQFETCVLLAQVAHAAPCPKHMSCCNKIAEAEAVVSVNEKKWLVMHVHV